MSTLLAALGGSAVTVVLFVVVYVLVSPDKAEKIFGWIAGGIGHVFRRLDKTAVALKVQGAINSMRTEVLKNAPKLIEKKLRIRWANVDEAEARLQDGECLVVMRRSEHEADNLAHAVMAYLPKALLPNARQYVDPDRMRAADLIIAKALLSDANSPIGALTVFLDKHLAPARLESVDLKRKITELDEIDLNGWLTRVLLAEYQQMGHSLFPGEPDERCIKDAEKFAGWLHDLACRPPGDESKSLVYKGQYYRVAVIFVARREVLERSGITPYRKRAKRHLYTDRFDAVYLMARDQNIGAVEELADALQTDALIASADRFTYPLRADFKKRKLNREKGIIICLRRKQGPNEGPPEPMDDDVDDLAEVVYEPDYSTSEIDAVVEVENGGGPAASD